MISTPSRGQETWGASTGTDVAIPPKEKVAKALRRPRRNAGAAGGKVSPYLPPDKSPRTRGSRQSRMLRLLSMMVGEKLGLGAR